MILASVCQSVTLLHVAERIEVLFGNLIFPTDSMRPLLNYCGDFLEFCTPYFFLERCSSFCQILLLTPMTCIALIGVNYEALRVNVLCCSYYPLILRWHCKVMVISLSYQFVSRRWLKVLCSQTHQTLCTYVMPS